MKKQYLLILVVATLALALALLLILPKSCSSPHAANEPRQRMRGSSQASQTDSNSSNETPAMQRNREHGIPDQFCLKRLEKSDNSDLRSAWKNDTTTISGGKGAHVIYYKGKVLLERDSDIGDVRQSPDGSMFMIFGPAGWGEMYQIVGDHAVKLKSRPPSLGDITWVWLENDKLLGVSNIYEHDNRPNAEMVFVENTKLYLYDIRDYKVHDIAWPALPLGKDELFRVDGVSASGEVELSAVTPEQYFDPNARDRLLGRFKVATSEK